MKSAFVFIFKFLFFIVGIMLTLFGILMIMGVSSATGIILIMSGIFAIPWISRKIFDMVNVSEFKETIIKIFIIPILFVVAIMADGPEIDNTNKVADLDSACSTTLTAHEGDILDISKLKCYEFGPSLTEALKEIGMDDITNAYFDFDFDGIGMIDIDVEGKTAAVECNLRLDGDENEWVVYEIRNENNSDIRYYVKDNYLDSQETILEHDIYSYKTGEIVQAVDKSKIAEYNAQIMAKEEQRKVEELAKIKQQASSDFTTIINDFQNNELSAEDRHKGKRYILVGYFDGATDDGLFNAILSEVNIGMYIYTDNGKYFVNCDFDADTWREQLLN